MGGRTASHKREGVQSSEKGLLTSVLVGTSVGRGPSTLRCQKGLSLMTWEET